VREEGFEPSRPFGHRILRLVRPGTDLGATCRPVSSGVTLCHPVSFRREQDVSENGAVACTHVYVERCPRIERVVGRLFEGEEAVLHVNRAHRGTAGFSGRRNVTLGGRATSGRLSGADPISWNPFRP
jgi:hypothetical protein